MANIKKLILVLCCALIAIPAYAQFSKNVIIYDDGVHVEGGGRILDLEDGITAEYDTDNGKYKLDVDGSGSAVMLCPDGKSGNYCLIDETGIFRLYMSNSLIAQWEKEVTYMDDMDGVDLAFVEGGLIAWVE